MSQGGANDPNAPGFGAGGPQFGAPPPSPPRPPQGYGQPYGQQGYGQQRYAQPYGQPTNGLAIAAIILTFVFAPAGLILGIMAKNQIRMTGEGGEGLATAAIIVSSIFTVIFVIWFIAVIALVGTAASHFNNNPPGMFLGF